MPTTLPSSSSTGRWLTPNVNMAMLASAARVSAPMACTGADMMALTGASRETPPTTTFSRRSASVTMPSPSRARTRIAERPSAVMVVAASPMVVSGSHSSGCSAHHRGDRQRVHLRQRAQGARRVEQCLALARRQPAHAVLAAEQLYAEVPGDAVERAVAACPHRERRRRAGEQAGVPEEFAGRHHGDQGISAQEVQGAVAQDEELLARAGRPRRSWPRRRARCGTSPRPRPRESRSGLSVLNASTRDRKLATSARLSPWSLGPSPATLAVLLSHRPSRTWCLVPWGSPVQCNRPSAGATCPKGRLLTALCQSRASPRSRSCRWRW